MSEININTREKELIKETLLKEARLSFDLSEKGIFFDKEKFIELGLLKTGFRARKGNLSFKLPHGVSAAGHFTEWTPYSVVFEDNTPILYDGKTPVGEISFKDRSTTNPVLDARLKNGIKFRSVFSISEEGGDISVAYSKECSLKSTGEDCLFCSINVRDRTNEELANLLLNPKIIAEAYDLARKAGVGNHMNISGGFVPERREVEYYIDVAEEIKKTYPDFYASAVIGAPSDLSIIDKLKESGYSFISHNLEVWDKNLFAHICPGKEKYNGGQQHWIRTLEYSAQVFGKGHAHCSIIGGLEPKASTLEGIEYLVSKGVVGQLNRIAPEKNTPLEGFRSPVADFHWDLADKVTDIYIRAGFTMKELTGKHSHFLTADLFRIKTGDFNGDKLTTWKYPALGQSKLITV